jgi:hypothetical protein
MLEFAEICSLGLSQYGVANFTIDDVPADFGPHIPDDGVSGLLVVSQ